MAFPFTCVLTLSSGGRAINGPALDPTYKVCWGYRPPEDDFAAKARGYWLPHVFGLAPDFARFPLAIG